MKYLPTIKDIVIAIILYVVFFAIAFLIGFDSKGGPTPRMLEHVASWYGAVLFIFTIIAVRVSKRLSN
jgi:hypothetical protein